MKNFTRAKTKTRVSAESQNHSSLFSAKLLRATGALALVLMISALAFSQTTGGAINGSVTDSSKAAIAGATITIVNQDTGDVRTVRANEKGLYTAPSLQPGYYQASAASKGFGAAVRKNLQVQVGQETVADFELRVGTVTESVEVNEQAPGVSLESSTISKVVAGQTVRDLPLNGRDWTMLAALEPGVHTIEAQTGITVGSNGRGNRGWGTQMTVAGSRPQQNNYRLDGISINDYSGGGPGSVLGSVLGTDAIQEFSVVTGNASAEYGKTSGGVINAVTRAGDNHFHGSAYEFARNSTFDARNYFDGPDAPPFSRNQFGGTFGGPIRRDETFFFINYEGLRQDLSSTTLTTVPSNAARSGQLTTGKVTVDPAVVPFLALFPKPNAGESGDTGVFSFVSDANTVVDLYSGRVDHKISNANNVHGTFMLANSETSGPDATNFVVTGQVSQSRLLSLEDSHIFSPNLLNVARVGYSRSISAAPIKATPVSTLATDPSLGFLPGRNVGTITITGITTLIGGIGAQAETDYHYSSEQVYDDLFYTHSAHSLKIGASFERVQSNELVVGSDPNGRFVFGSIQAFLRNQPQSFNATIPGASPAIYLRQSVAGLYVSDDYRATRNLTFNLGMRYEMATVPTEKNDRLSNLPSLTAATPQLGSPYFNNPTLRDFSPRVGFSWDPFAQGKTAIRGGFGIYDTLPLLYQFGLLAVNEAPFFQSGSVTTLSKGAFPTAAFNSLTANNLGYAYIDPNPKRSYVEQWNLNIQQQLTNALSLHLGYTGQHGLHQPLRTTDANIVLPVQTSPPLLWPTPRGSGHRLNPSVGAINALAWESANTYHGLNVGVSGEHKGLRLGASYTWSKSIDNSSSSLTVTNFNNSLLGSFLFDPQIARGLSDFDVRHNLVVNSTWKIPSISIGNSFAGRIANGWQVGGIFRAASGLPFTPVIGGDALGLLNSSAFDFPDRLDLPGCGNPVNPGNPLHYIKTECFAVPQPGTRLGNSGRNIAIGPGLTNLDASLFKNNYFAGERFNLQFRAELFNVLNHTNFSVPDRTSAQLFSQNLAPLSTVGLLKTTSTTSRQIQLAVKLIF